MDEIEKIFGLGSWIDWIYIVSFCLFVDMVIRLFRRRL